MDLFKKKSKVPMLRVKGNSHGTHWESVHPNFDFIKTFLKGSLHPSIRDRCLIKLFRTDFADMGKTQIGVFKRIIHPRLCSIFVLATIKGVPQVATGYPVLWSRTRVRFEPKEIQEWPIQIESDISGKIGDAGLSFFPVDFFMKKQEYLEGTINELSLGLFAYEQKTEPWAGQFVEGKDNQKFSLEKAEIIFPLWKDGQHPDDYRVIGKAIAVEQVKILNDISGVFTTISLKPIGELEIFCLTSKMDRVPNVGEMVGAVGWLQGRDSNIDWPGGA